MKIVIELDKSQKIKNGDDKSTESRMYTDWAQLLVLVLYLNLTGGTVGRVGWRWRGQRGRRTARGRSCRCPRAGRCRTAPGWRSCWWPERCCGELCENKSKLKSHKRVHKKQSCCKKCGKES